MDGLKNLVFVELMDFNKKELRLKTAYFVDESLADQKLPKELRLWTDADYRNRQSPHSSRLKVNPDGFTKQMEGSPTPSLPTSGTAAHGAKAHSSTYDEIVPQNQRDEALKDWHKDSHPLTKNEDGTPKVFYHGTGADFDIFDIEKSNIGNFGKGFYFAEDVSKVNKYFAKSEKSNIMPVILDIKNPFDMRKIDEKFAKEYLLSISEKAEIPSESKSFLFYKLLMGRKSTQELREYIEKMG